MSTVIDEAGQVTITIPLAVRERLGLSAGSMVDFRVDDDGSVHMQKVLAIPERMEAIRRTVGTLDLGMTTDEFMLLMRGDD